MGRRAPGGRQPGGGGGGRQQAAELPLHAAARTGDMATVRSVSSSNPLAINDRDKHSRTPLHLAAWSGHTEVVSYLCRHKADVGAAAMDDMGAIHFASQKGHLDIVRILVSSGVSAKAANRKGFTPLHFAVRGSHMDLAKYLIRKGASLSAKTKVGETPLDFASSDEVRSMLTEMEKLSKEEQHTAGSKKPARWSSDHGRDGDSGGRDMAKDDEEGTGDEREKRKSSDARTAGDASASKKPRVALGHLAEDDLQEEAE